MTQLLRYLLVTTALALLIGCQSAPIRSAEPDISLDDAKTLIISGKVKEIFQPHQGCVVLTLKDGGLVSFDQPYLDWVLSFVSEQGLSDAIPVSVE